MSNGCATSCSPGFAPWCPQARIPRSSMVSSRQLARASRRGASRARSRRRRARRRAARRRRGRARRRCRPRRPARRSRRCRTRARRRRGRSACRWSTCARSPAGSESRARPAAAARAARPGCARAACRSRSRGRGSRARPECRPARSAPRRRPETRSTSSTTSRSYSATRLLCITTSGAPRLGRGGDQLVGRAPDRVEQVAAGGVRGAEDLGLERVDRDDRVGHAGPDRGQRGQQAGALDLVADRACSPAGSTPRRRRSCPRRPRRAPPPAPPRRAASGTPSPENESGVTLTIPIT